MPLLPKLLRCVAVTVGLSSFAVSSMAFSAPSTGMGGFKIDNKQPIEINSDTLSVNNNQQSATFNGNVQVAQGNLRMKSNSLTVLYDISGKKTESAGSSGQAPEASSPTSDSIRSLSADGNVFVTSADGSAKGNKAVYDVSRQFLTVTGDVVLHQGDNVLKGEKLVINVKTGVSTISGGGSSGRVKTIFKPSSNK